VTTDPTAAAAASTITTAATTEKTDQSTTSGIPCSGCGVGGGGNYPDGGIEVSAASASVPGTLSRHPLPTAAITAAGVPACPPSKHPFNGRIEIQAQPEGHIPDVELHGALDGALDGARHGLLADGKAVVPLAEEAGTRGRAQEVGPKSVGPPLGTPHVPATEASS
jgi:hypothetical protein